LQIRCTCFMWLLLSDVLSFIIQYKRINFKFFSKNNIVYKHTFKIKLSQVRAITYFGIAEILAPTVT
jgi:hypothetical protein